MPKIEQTIANVNVRSHTFRFIPPSAIHTSKVPNPCTGCYTDKSNEWAIDAPRTRPELSPWRVGP
jgi:hypothetical protein